MSSIPKGANRELVPEGTHVAVCVQVIDLGTQSSEQWGDKRKVQLAFELVDERTTDDKAMVCYRQYTFSASPKGNLMKDLKGWIGKEAVGEFDMDNLLGKAASITVEHNETDKGTFANITNIAGLPKGSKVKKSTEPLRSLYLDETFDADTFEVLPDFLKEKIMVTKEYEEHGVPSKKKGSKVPPKKGKK